MSVVVAVPVNTVNITVNINFNKHTVYFLFNSPLQDNKQIHSYIDGEHGFCNISVH